MTENLLLIEKDEQQIENPTFELCLKRHTLVDM